MVPFAFASPASGQTPERGFGVEVGDGHHGVSGGDLLLAVRGDKGAIFLTVHPQHERAGSALDPRLRHRLANQGRAKRDDCIFHAQHAPRVAKHQFEESHLRRMKELGHQAIPADLFGEHHSVGARPLELGAGPGRDRAGHDLAGTLDRFSREDHRQIIPVVRQRDQDARGAQRSRLTKHALFLRISVHSKRTWPPGRNDGQLLLAVRNHDASVARHDQLLDDVLRHRR